MQHGHGAIELRLSRGTTRNRKMNLAKLFCGFLLRRYSGSTENPKDSQRHKYFHGFHRPTPFRHLALRTKPLFGFRYFDWAEYRF